MKTIPKSGKLERKKSPLGLKPGERVLLEGMRGKTIFLREGEKPGRVVLRNVQTHPSRPTREDEIQLGKLVERKQALERRGYFSLSEGEHAELRGLWRKVDSAGAPKSITLRKVLGVSTSSISLPPVPSQPERRIAPATEKRTASISGRIRNIMAARNKDEYGNPGKGNELSPKRKLRLARALGINVHSVEAAKTLASTYARRFQKKPRA